MKTIFTFITILFGTFTFAQAPVYWVGGTPGQETSWNVARNWSNHQVPDESTRVIIRAANSGHQAQPVISGEVAVLSLEIQSGARLQIGDSGILTIDGRYGYSDGIMIYSGQLENAGSILMLGFECPATDLAWGAITGTGRIVIDDRELNAAILASH